MELSLASLAALAQASPLHPLIESLHLASNLGGALILAAIALRLLAPALKGGR